MTAVEHLNSQQFGKGVAYQPKPTPKERVIGHPLLPAAAKVGRVMIEQMLT